MDLSVLNKFGKFSTDRKNFSSHKLFTYKTWNCSVCNASVLGFMVILILGTSLNAVQGFNDEKGILKWNPYWFSNFRYSSPSSFYISPSKIGGTPYKRLSDTMWNTGGPSALTTPTGTGNSIYKWSPIYFSGGSVASQPSSYLGGNNGYMYSSTRPRWSLSDYGGSRFLTRYYGGNSFAPSARSSAGIDLTSGTNDLSALLGEEMMNKGLGLDRDAVDVLNEDNEPEITDQKSR